MGRRKAGGPLLDESEAPLLDNNEAHLTVDHANEQRQQLLVNNNDDEATENGPLVVAGASGHKHKQFKLYKSRWVMLVLVILLQISSAMLWISFAPVIKIAEEYYDTSSFMIDFQSMIFMIVSVPLGFAGTYVLNMFGLRAGIFIAAVCNGIGGAVRFVGDFAPSPATRLIVTTIGQGIAAMAQPVFLDSPTLLAATWFGEHERAEANMAASIANPVGIAVGSLVSGLMVVEGSDMRWMLLVNAIVAVIVLIFTLLFFKDKPPTAPSPSAEENHLTFKEGMKVLIKTPAYYLLLVGFGIGIALISTLSSVFAQITQYNGYTPDQASYFSIAMVGVGFLGAGLSGYLVDKTGAFLTIFKVSYVGATGGVVLFYLMNKPGHFVGLMCACGLIGFFGFAALPIGLELCVETTFPVNEGLSAGLVWIMSQVFSIIFLVSTNSMKGEADYFNGTIPYTPPNASMPLPPGISTYYDYTSAMYMFMGATGFAAFLVLIMTTKYKRLEAEKQA